MCPISESYHLQHSAPRFRNASKRLTTFSLCVTKLKYNECNDVVDNGKFMMETFHWVSSKSRVLIKVIQIFPISAQICLKKQKRVRRSPVLHLRCPSFQLQMTKSSRK